MPLNHHDHFKSLRLSLFIVSVFVPHIIFSLTTKTKLSVNDTTISQNGKKSPLPIQRNNFSQIQRPILYQRAFIQQPLIYPETNATKAHAEGREEPTGIEEKFGLKTIVGIKEVTVGSIILSFFLLLVVLVLAALSKLGVALTSESVILATLPIAIAALGIFIPLSAAFTPFDVVKGEAEKRQKMLRFIDENKEYYILQTIKENIGQLVENWQPAYNPPS